MKIKIQKLNPNAVIPEYKKDGDAGLDLVATEILEKEDLNIIEYKTGLALEIPKGYVGLIFPRSSISKYDLHLSNAVGIIDSGYRGEISLRFSPDAKAFLKLYNVGDRIGQIIILPYPEVLFEEVQELTETTRGEGGFGSTGVK